MIKIFKHMLTFSHTKKQENKYCEELLKEKEWFLSKQFPVFLPQDKFDITTESDLLKQKIDTLKKAWKAVEINLC